MSYDKRLSKLESSDDQQPRDICIDVEYVDVIDTPEGRKEFALSADYDPVDWEAIEPQANSDRIAVRFPRSENLSDAKRKSD